ncbi:hypothetical protein H2198_008829 [Neophaeococcomyces mojaviensis]|uniref:Uncharacterized protein n=1 Tax=Neophaeococcomyces mojaviensis TaxID=3383035 RepID=A0ACC2ZWA6_9EURO|nr:hypothetical protein H2198_008829 [Knufia sp. JES_112]
MADDASYNTFLARANQDPKSGHSGEAESTSQARGKFDPSTEPNEAIPAPLKNLNATYVSDTDSEFEPVFFSYSATTLPSEEDFRLALGIKGHNAGKIEELSTKDFDPRGEYKAVIDAVGSVGKGKAKGAVKVFRVEVDDVGTRVQYYVLTVGERKLLGVVAKAVES